MNNIQVQNFKPKLVHMEDGKLLRVSEEVKDARRDSCSSPGLILEAVRMPNISLKAAVDQMLQESPCRTDGFSSPTNILTNNQVYDNLQLAGFQEEDDFTQFEGELFRRASEGKLKRYWYCLLGKELYCNIF